MELFNRVKSILINPKEEWEIIEAENEPHSNVFAKHLLILALIPTLAFFANEFLKNRNLYNEYIENGISRIESSPVYRSNIYDTAEIKAEKETSKTKEIAEFEENASKAFQVEYPFSSIKWNIIFAVSLLVILIGGAYISAAIINSLSNQFGTEKDFDQAFSLVAYSYTPLCVAGILYAFDSFTSLVLYIGLYGLFLLYLGIGPMLKPASEKKITSFIITLVVIVGVLAGLTKVAVPEIQKKIMTDEKISILKDNHKGSEPFKIDAKTKKSIEKQMESELKNHKYY